MRTTPICVDASVVIPLVTRRAEGSPVAKLWRSWYAAGRRLVAPTLLYYEVSNALHRYAVHGELESDEAAAALEAALSLDVELYRDRALHQRALMLAEAPGLPATYDAHYLALAERLEAELWTADRRLYAAVQAAMPQVNLVKL